MTEIEIDKNSTPDLIELNDENSQKENIKEKKEEKELNSNEKNENDENYKIEYEMEIDPKLLTEKTSEIDDFYCPLCKGLLNDPVIDKCSHTFCKKCFEKFYNLYHLCPITKSKLEDGNLTQVPLITKSVGKRIIKCKNIIKGCNWIGKISDFKNHLENECLKSLIKCPFEGCNNIIMRENLNTHKNQCEYRNVECLDCHKNFPFKILSEHSNICPKKKINCPQECGLIIERGDIDNHIKNFCDCTLVDCSYKKYGCSDRYKKKEFDKKMKDDCAKHLLLITGIIDRIEKSVINKKNNNLDVSEEFNFDFEHLKRKRVREKENEIDLNKDNDNDKEMEIDNNLIFSKKINNTNNNTINNSFNKNNNNNNINININNKNNNNNLNGKNNINNNILNNNNHNIHNNNNININDNNININNEKIIKTPTKNNNEIIYFDMKNINPNIKIDDNVARFNTSNVSEHVFLFVNPIFDIDSSNKNTILWTIKLLNLSKWIAFGLCDKEKVKLNKGKFCLSSKNEQFNNGAYLVSNNGYSWNCNNMNENNKQISFPSFEENNEFTIEFNPIDSELSFLSKEKVFCKLTLVKPHINPFKLTPCIVFLNKNDGIEFNMLTN